MDGRISLEHVGQVAAELSLGLLYPRIIPPGITVAAARNGHSSQRFFPFVGRGTSSVTVLTTT